MSRESSEPRYAPGMPSAAPRIAALLVGLVAIAGCTPDVLPTASGSPSCAPRLPTTTVTLDGATETTLTAEIADAADDRERGLAGRATLPSGCAMLFRYPTPVRNAFWMRGMAFPIDIAFADGDGRIVEIVTLDRCTADPCPTHVPVAPYRFALEVGAGTLAALGIGVGDRLVVSPP